MILVTTEIQATQALAQKVIIVRTANDFVYKNMNWDELGFTKKEN